MGRAQHHVGQLQQRLGASVLGSYWVLLGRAQHHVGQLLLKLGVWVLLDGHAVGCSTALLGRVVIDQQAHVLHDNEL